MSLWNVCKQLAQSNKQWIFVISLTLTNWNHSSYTWDILCEIMASNYYLSTNICRSDKISHSKVNDLLNPAPPRALLMEWWCAPLTPFINWWWYILSLKFSTVDGVTCAGDHLVFFIDIKQLDQFFIHMGYFKWSNGFKWYMEVSYTRWQTCGKTTIAKVVE